MLKKLQCSLLFVISLLYPISYSAHGQTIVQSDPLIQKMAAEVSSKNLETIVRKLVSFETRHSLSTTSSKNKGIGAARNWVKDEFEKYGKEAGGRLVVELDPYVLEPDGKRVSRRIEMKNVMATLKGTDPSDDRVLIVSGHLDSRASDVMDSEIAAPGANDDASGVALVMELCRVMSKRKFPCTIVFVAVAGEEQGLLGSTHLAKKAKAANWNIVAMFNNDIVGNSQSNETLYKDNTTVRVFSEGVPAYETEQMEKQRKRLSSENDSNSRQLARYIKETGERYIQNFTVTLIYRNDRFLRGGDHTPFNKEGYTAVRFTEMNENFDQQHQNVRQEGGKQYGDLPEFVDYNFLSKVSAVNLTSIANLALAPYAPEQVQIDVKNLSNSSSISWRPSAKGARPKGYYLLMRETTSAIWQKKFYVEDLKITVPYSKDNFLFAIQSVDDKGHESIPVIPVPL